MDVMSNSHPQWSEFYTGLLSKVKVGLDEKRCSGTGRRELARETLVEMGFTNEEIKESLVAIGGLRS